ncbi:unnamed protein product [Thlaspi arvense]|uniref:Reverse transcriptase zinc-binding domain-containing protein n=1 Tax=Thlaspi arvense TaxID=13288 RepID=A0AAU9RPY9_THLAR|nr:unnamed protein product [Thlaspi arvense]
MPASEIYFQGGIQFAGSSGAGSLFDFAAASASVLNDLSSVNVLVEQEAREKAEESFSRQRTRIKWLGDRDLDTRFYHMVTTARNASNAIKYLIQADGTKTSSFQQKLSIYDCNPLISKIRMKLNGWTYKHLSLAGRLRLISTSISGIIGFWTQAFFLRKTHGLILLTQRMMAVWVYDGGFYLGGMDETLLYVSSLFLTPFGSLIHYLGPQGSSSMGIPINALVNEFISSDGWSLPPARSDCQVNVWAYICSLNKSVETDYPVWHVGDAIFLSFVSKEIWEKICTVKPVMSWSSLIWHKVAIPKHATTTWVVHLDRNPTLNRLLLWGLDDLWIGIMHKLHFTKFLMSWVEIIVWLPTTSSSSDRSLAMLQGWQACICEIWRERNRRFHDGITLPPQLVLHMIVTVIKNKTMALENMGFSKGDSLGRIWSSESHGTLSHFQYQLCTCI